jgi:RimJ/RimL family protein N-acetyltransferase
MLPGKKIRLVPMEREDLPKSQTWVNDVQLNIKMLRVLPVSRLDQERWLEEISRNHSKLVFAIKDIVTSCHIGNTGFYSIDWIHRRSEYWILIGEKDYWGQGIGSEVLELMQRYAFKNLNLNKLYLNVGANNHRAIAVYKKLGFVQEALLREHYYIEGEYTDVIAMSIIRKDYDNQE